MTAYELASKTYDANYPIDWAWVKHLRRNATKNQLHAVMVKWIKGYIEYHGYGDAYPSKQKIGRAANMLNDWLQ